MDAEQISNLFASRLNFQITKFVSYRPDPNSSVVNAFTLNWGNLDFYAFPPFAIISRVIQKIIRYRGTGILSVPDWPNQLWYTVFNEIIINIIIMTEIIITIMVISSIIIYPRIYLLQLAQIKKIHSLHRS